MAVMLSDAIDEYLIARGSGGYRPNTIRNDEHNLKQFLAGVGNIQVRNITPRHLDAFMAAGATKNLSPSTMNLAPGDAARVLHSLRAAALHRRPLQPVSSPPQVPRAEEEPPAGAGHRLQPSPRLH